MYITYNICTFIFNLYAAYKVEASVAGEGIWYGQI